MQSPDDIFFMQRCMQLALLGSGAVAPNPLVGAVLVSNGKIISEGYHQKFGEAHAEVNCLRNIEVPEHATLYVNLEPCNHYGKTPPCSELIIAKKVTRVVIGCADPNPLVSGKGIEKLKANGIDVTIGVCEEECKTLNRRFITFIEKKRPYIVLKFAQSTDGFIGRALHSVLPKQLSNPYSQRLTHKWRAEEQAILIGTTTALTDNPKLDARLYNHRNPVRVVIDAALKIPDTFHLYDGSSPTLIFNTKKNGITVSGTKLIQMDFSKNDTLETMLSLLCKENINSILVEGGAQTIHNFITQGYWDEARVFTTPWLWGTGVKSPILGPYSLKEQEEKIDTDVLTIYKNTKQ